MSGTRMLLGMAEKKRIIQRRIKKGRFGYEFQACLFIIKVLV